MTASTMTAKQTIEDYFAALSGKPKTEQVIDQFVDDPTLKQHILQTEASFPNYELIPIHIVAEGDIVAVNSTFTATQKGRLPASNPPARRSPSVR